MKIDVMRSEINLEFIQARIKQDSKYYSGFRGAFKVSDLVAGLVGELAVAKHYGVGCSAPDTTIYEKGKKSYDADLSTGCGKNIHVKSQTKCSQDKFGKAWVLQQWDGIFKGWKDDEYLALVSVDIPSKVDLENLPEVISVEIEEIVLIKELKGLFASPERMEMDVHQLRNSKFAIRLDEVRKELTHGENA